MLRIFTPVKIPTASAGFEPANLGARGQLGHRSRLHSTKDIILIKALYFPMIYSHSSFISSVKQRFVARTSEVRITAIFVRITGRNSTVPKRGYLYIA